MVTSTAPTEAMNSIAFTSANPISSSARTADVFLRYGGKCFKPDIGTENFLLGVRGWITCFIELSLYVIFHSRNINILNF